VIIARNLETLALAGAASSLFGGSVPVVYECLDIHRLLLDEGIKGRLLRSAEGYFGRDARLLLTSSPAFVENYFHRRSRLNVPIVLLENKVLELGSTTVSTPAGPRLPGVGEPWRIGWFGAIRCRKSFGILAGFAKAMNGMVEIVIRGRPSAREFPDFEAQVRAAPHVRFHGAYRNPEDLSAIYRDVQFVWAIDFFEEGLNSNWLLPNRLYEGSLHGAIPIGVASTETGRFLASRGLGMLLQRADADELVARFASMTRDAYLELFNHLAATDRSQWVTDRADCVGLVGQLTQVAAPSSARPDPAITSTLQSES
jgi:succinoglycan biosynthesis protein ExoL